LGGDQFAFPFVGLLDPKGLPVASIDSAKKLLDETRLPTR